MFDIGSSELLLIVIVAVVVIGPKDLPRVLYKVGQYVGKARAMTRHFRAGIDEMVRHAEMEELEKKWAAENARIMAQHPAIAPAPSADEALPADAHMVPLKPEASRPPAHDDAPAAPLVGPSTAPSEPDAVGRTGPPA